MGIGLVKSLRHPGGRATGLSSHNFELTAKRLSLLKETLPSLNKAGVLEYRNDEPHAQATLSMLYEAAQTLGIATLHSRVDTADELGPAFEAWARQGIRAFVCIPNVWFSQDSRLRQLSALALKYRIANCYSTAQGPDAGLLMSYSVDFIALFRRSAKLVDRILKGADPADIPVEQADVYELVLNQRTARAIGANFPYSVRLQATRVIE